VFGESDFRETTTSFDAPATTLPLPLRLVSRSFDDPTSEPCRGEARLEERIEDP